MKRIILVVCVLSLGVAGAMPTEEERTKSEAAVAKNPDDARSRDQLATEYALRGKWSKAVPLFAKVEVAMPDGARKIGNVLLKFARELE